MRNYDLHRALNFDEQDLAANRAGRLSGTQRARLQRLRRRMLLIRAAAIAGIGLLATVMLFVGLRRDSLNLSLIGMALTVLNAVSGALLARSWLRLTADIGGGQVEAVGGTVAHTIRVTGRVATYVLIIDTEEIIVPKGVFLAFKEQAAYALYRAPNSRILLAAEAR